MIKQLNTKDIRVAQHIFDIQIPAYRVEAELIGTSDIPPLKDTVESIQQCGETFVGYLIGEELCGFISFKQEDGLVDIHRLVVHPRHFRKGIAQLLLDFVELRLEAERMIVSTGTANTPAVQFYQKNGFQITQVIQVNENLSLTMFQKDLEDCDDD